jgi:hypothetical protein
MWREVDESWTSFSLGGRAGRAANSENGRARSGAGQRRSRREQARAPCAGGQRQGPGAPEPSGRCGGVGRQSRVGVVAGRSRLSFVERQKYLLNPNWRSAAASRSCRWPPALLPAIPLPTKIRIAFQDPISVDRDPDRAEDDDYVEAKYHEVRASIQHGMDALARRWRLPLFG